MKREMIRQSNFKSSASGDEQMVYKNISGFDILNIIIWEFDLDSKDFTLLSQDFGFEKAGRINYKKFTKAIKPCYRNYYFNFFTEFQHFIKNDKTENRDSYSLQAIIPMILHYKGYYLFSLYAVPAFKGGRLSQWYFIALPLKKYNNENLSVQVHNNFQKNGTVTSQIKKKVASPKPLTEKQYNIFRLLLQGFSSYEIAEILNKKRNNVLKYYSRINDKLSSFFDINFATVKDAVEYYKKSF